VRFFQLLENVWPAGTSEDYDFLGVMSDWVEEHPDQLNLWFERVKNVLISFSGRTDACYRQLSDAINSGIFIGELEDDPIEGMDNLINLHMLNAVHRVLDDKITHNGPLFSFAQAIKNSYESLSPHLRYQDYYYNEDDDPDPQNLVGKLNANVHKLIQDYIRFIRFVFPFFTRVASFRWKTPTDKRNSLERLKNVPGPDWIH
jgi:hypothetical protein